MKKLTGWQTRRNTKFNETPKSRREAIEKCSKIYWTGLPCKNGHVSEMRLTAAINQRISFQNFKDAKKNARNRIQKIYR